MLLAQIETFLAVARTGNVNRAADLLFLTQPAVSARLKALESELDVTLFERSRRGMRLTEAGQVFLPYAERGVAEFAEGRARLERLSRYGGDVLLLGAAPGVSTYALPAMLEQFTRHAPAVGISVRTGHTEEVLGMVLRGEVQLGLGRALQHPDITATPLYQDELVLVVPHGHTLGGAQQASLGAIAADRLILFDRSSSYYELTQSLFRSAGIIPSRIMELDNIEAAKRMVERGLGVALLPRVAAARDAAEGRLHLLPLADSPPIQRPIVAFRRRDQPELSTVTRFLELATQMTDGHGDPG